MKENNKWKYQGDSRYEKVYEKMQLLDIQDRIVLDEMVDTFTAEMNKNHDEAELMDKRPIITREYWLHDTRSTKKNR